jgi:hypothetical protein
VAVHRQSALSRSVWIVLAIALVASAGLWAFHAYVKLGDQLSTLAGITLGDTRGEIRYKRGVPPVVYGGKDDGQGSGIRAYYTDRETDPSNALPDGADINTYRTWSYDSGPSPNAHLNISFDAGTGRTSRIDCIDQLEPPTSFCPRVVGIGISDPELRVTSILGRPTRQSIDDHSGVKTMIYDDLGLVFLLAQQRVYGISVQGIDAHKREPIGRFLEWSIGQLSQQ